MSESRDFPSLIQGLDHVKIVVPRTEEAKARDYYGRVLGLPEVPKPDALQERGGAWYRCGSQQLHLGLEDPVMPSSLAHPAFQVGDLDALRRRLEEAGMPIIEEVPVPDFQRFSTRDPFGNRLEFVDRSVISPAKDQVRRMYSRAAQAYVTSPGHAAGDDLSRLVALADPRPSDLALDVSTGGGHTALALAPQVASVTASDLTPRMLATARDFIAGKGQRNVSFVVADAEQLPFLDASFDLVTVRIAPHHYPQVEVAVAEMARVLKPGGRLIMVDNIAPEDPLLDRYMNEWEKRRDPSHVRACTQSEWDQFVTGAGLRIEVAETGRKQHDFASWAERMQMPAVERDRLAADMLAAPPAIRDFFAVQEEDGRLVSWSADYLILRATR